MSFRRLTITSEEIALAEKHCWRKYEEDPIQWNLNKAGNLAEIKSVEFCKYFDSKVEWKPKTERDTGYDIYLPTFGERIQVKSVLDEPYKKKIYLEKRSGEFDAYILCIVAQDFSYVEIFALITPQFAELNSHIDVNYNNRAIYYRL